MRFITIMAISAHLIFSQLVLGQEIKSLGKINLDKMNYSLHQNITVRVSDDQFVIYQKDKDGACYLASFNSSMQQLWKTRLKNNDQFFPEIFFLEKRNKLLFFQNIGVADNFGCFVQEHDISTGKRTNTVQLTVKKNRPVSVKVSPNELYFLLTDLSHNDPENPEKNTAITFDKDWEQHDMHVLDKKVVVDVAVNDDGELLVLKKTTDNLILLESLYSRKMEEHINFNANTTNGSQLMVGSIYQHMGNYYVPLVTSAADGTATQSKILFFDAKEYQYKTLASIDLESKLLKKANTVSLKKESAKKVPVLKNIQAVDLKIDNEGNSYLICKELITNKQDNSSTFVGGNLLINAFDSNGKNMWNTLVERTVQYHQLSFKFKKGTETIEPGTSITSNELRLLIPASKKTDTNQARNLYLIVLNTTDGNLKLAQPLLNSNNDHLVPTTGRLWLTPKKILLFNTTLNANPNFSLDLLDLGKFL